MNDVPIVLIAHPDGLYSLGDTGDRIALEKVTLDEITDYLENRHERLHPAPTADEIWDQYHPAAEPAIDLALAGLTSLTLTTSRETGRLLVRDNVTEETLAQDVSAAQVFRSLATRLIT